MPLSSARYKFRWGIASSVTLSMVFVIVLLMGLVTFVDIRRERAIARAGLERYGILMANSLNEILADNLYFSQIDALQDIAEVLASQPQITEVKMFRPDGRLLVKEPRDKTGSEYVTGRLVNAAALRAVRNGEEWQQFGGTTLDLVIPVSAEGNLLGGVQFSFTSDELNEEIRSIILEHLWQGFALAALGSVLAYLIARYTSRSIGVLAAVAREIGQGNLSIPAPSRGTKETIELGQALEGMRVQLQELYPNLEERVEERTTELSRVAQELKVEVAERERAEQEQRRLTEESQMVAGIGRVIGSSLNVVEVYEGFAALVSRLVPSDWISINKIDRQRGTMTRAYASGSIIPGRGAGVVESLSGTFTEAVAQSPQGLYLDVEDVEDCARRYPGLVPYLEVGVRSFLGVPLVSRGEVIATLNLIPSVPIAYTEHHLRLARNIGAQIAGAIANAEVYSQREKAEQAARQLASANHLLADVGRIITLSPNIDDVYHRFADRVREHMPFDYMSISLVNVEDGVSISSYVSGIDVPGRRPGDRIPLPGSLTGTVLNTRTAKLMATDNRDDLSRQFPGLLPAFDAGLRSFMAVPLITADELIGVLNVRSSQQNVYSERELGLMEQVGFQISPAIENARLFEQVKSNAEEMAAVDEVGRLVTTSLDLDQVYERFADEVKKLVDFDRMAINVIDEDAGVFTFKYSAGLARPGRQIPDVVPLEGSQTERVLQTSLTLVVPDISSNSSFSGTERFLQEGLRSSIMVPLIHQGRVLGTMSLRSRSVDAYTSRHQTVLERLASQIAPAVENAQLYEQLRSNSEEMAVVDQVASIVTSTLDIEQVYEEFAIEASKLVEFERMAIILLDLDGKRFTPKYTYGLDVTGRNVSVAGMEGTQSYWVMTTGQTLVRRDIKEEPHFLSDEDYLAVGIRSSIMVPLVSKGKVIGTFTARGREVGAFGVRDRVILERLASQIAPAVENAQLYEQLRSNAEEMALVDQVASIVTSTLDIEQVYEDFAFETRKLVDFDRIYINRLDQESGSLESKYISGMPVENLNPGRISLMKGSQSEEVVKSGGSIIRRDISEDMRFNNDASHLASGLRSSIAVPLISEGEIIGILGLRNRAVDTYGLRERTILERLASQIAPAVQSAQLYEQTKGAEEVARRLAEENRLVAEIGRIVSSSLDINETYELFAAQVRNLIPFSQLQVAIIDQQREFDEVAFSTGLPGSETGLGETTPMEGSITGHVASSRRGLIIQGMDSDELELHYPCLESSARAGNRSWLAVPLITRDEAIGSLFITSTKHMAFTQYNLEMAQRIGNQIAPAVENADLFQKVDQLAMAIANIGEGVCVTDPDGRILFVNQALEQILDYQPGELVGGPVSRLYPKDVEAPGLQRLMAGVVAGGWSGEVELLAKDGERIPSLETAAAIYDPSSRLVGFVCTDMDIRERKLSEEELRHRNLELQSLSRRLVEVQEAERRHVARELHDEIGQVLTGLKLSLEVLPRMPEKAVKANLEESKIMVNELMGKVRELSLDLRPAMLDDLGLLPTLLWYFERFTARTQVDVGFEHSGLDRRFLPEVETTAYRIIQEALTNVARYAGADQVSVRLWSNENVIGLSIKDNGSGFDASDVSNLNQSNGLAGMRERAALLGGQLSLESTPGIGTNLFAELPFGAFDYTSGDRNGYDHHSPGG